MHGIGPPDIHVYTAGGNMKSTFTKILALLLLPLALLTTQPVLAKDKFKIAWSIYVGWMPWAYAAEYGIVDKWAEKYGIEIEVVQINDYIESINQYTADAFDGCVMTNMDALSIPAGGALTLVTAGPYYAPGNSSAPPLPTRAMVYALVDSFAPGSPDGAVQEADESNNLFGPVISTPQAAATAPPGRGGQQGARK